ncbi:ATP-binding protein [Alicyclobacillus acidoterrestris]|uniref:ATP-binding protein n=1 Tax=Alicyclobacillus acidoterrestris TaxID=1450 RepID=UPI0009DC395D
MLGKVGTGKTHLATALGVEACRRGHDQRVQINFDISAGICHQMLNGSCIELSTAYPEQAVTSGFGCGGEHGNWQHQSFAVFCLES